MSVWSGTGHETAVTVTLAFFSFRVPSELVAWAVLIAVYLLAMACGVLYLRMRPRIERRSTSRSADPGRDEVGGYLQRVSDQLHLPAGLEADVLNEIAGHLDDTIRGLRDGGMAEADAIKEALRRVGPPERLGRDLREAQQTRRRLLAGVGGAVFGATAGVILGLMAGLVLLLPAMILLPMLGGLLPGIGDAPAWDAAKMVSALGFVIAGFMTARVTTRLAAGMSRRAVPPVGVIVAVIGTPLALWMVLRTPQSTITWPIAALTLATPVAFAVGALTAECRIRWPSRRGRIAGWGLIALGALVVAIPFAEPDDMEATIGGDLDVIAPLVAAGLVPETTWNEDRIGMDTQCRTDDGLSVECRFAVRNENDPNGELTGWSDLRMEVWRGVGTFGDKLDPRATAPLATAPVRVDGDDLVGLASPGYHRHVVGWLSTLTGVGPDGRRYRLADTSGEWADRSPTLLEWLQATD